MLFYFTLVWNVLHTYKIRNILLMQFYLKILKFFPNVSMFYRFDTKFENTK